MIDPENSRIALFGLGPLGVAVARNLLNAGYPLCVFDAYEDGDAGCELQIEGAELADGMADLCTDADVIIVLPEDPSLVEEIFLGDDGVLEFAEEGACLINMASCSPRLSYEIYACAAVNDQSVLDAPFVGGDLAAAAGELSFFVGGDKKSFDAAQPLLELLGKRIRHMGACGMGQLAKLCNQIALAGSLMGAVEACALARVSGLDPALLMEGISLTDAGSAALFNLMPLVLKGDYSSGYFCKYFKFELETALDIADSLELTIPGSETAAQLLDLLCTVDGGELGIQAMALLYEDEQTCADNGLNWSKAEGYFHEEGGCDCDCDCDDDCCCHDDCNCDDDDCGCGHAHGQGHANGPAQRRRPASAPEEQGGFPMGPGPDGFGGFMGSFFSSN